MSNPNATDKIEKFKKIFDEEINRKKILDAKYADTDIKEGDTYIRILPNADAEKHFFLKSGFHKIMGEYYNCPKEYKNAKCPICEYVSKLYKSQNIEDLELAKELKKTKRFYYNVIVRGTEDKGVRVLTSGIKLFEKIIGACANPEIGDITDLNEGFDFKVNKRMKDGYWNYDLSEASRRASPISTDPIKAKEWMSNLFDLDKEVTLLSYPELKEILNSALEQLTGEPVSQPQIQKIEEKVVNIQAPKPVQAAPKNGIDEEIEAFKKSLEDIKTDKK
jgi:hypothetical protein